MLEVEHLINVLAKRLTLRDIDHPRLEGRIAEINPALKGSPNIINNSPYDEGWVALIEPSDLDTDLAELIKGDDSTALDAWLKEEIAKTA